MVTNESIDNQLITRIKKLQEQKNHLLLTLSEFLEDASDWAQFAEPDLIGECDRLLELSSAFLGQIEHARKKLDDIEKKAAAQFVENYIQRPGK